MKSSEAVYTSLYDKKGIWTKEKVGTSWNPLYRCRKETGKRERREHETVIRVGLLEDSRDE